MAEYECLNRDGCPFCFLGILFSFEENFIQVLLFDLKVYFIMTWKSVNLTGKASSEGRLDTTNFTFLEFALNLQNKQFLFVRFSTSKELQNILCLPECYIFLLISNKFCDSSLLHWVGVGGGQCAVH